MHVGIAVVAVALAIVTYPKRQRERAIAGYDTQKVACQKAVEAFVAELESEGYRVTNDSCSFGGSGDWRLHAAVRAQKVNLTDKLCYVEVQGFVTEDWMHNLPMTISCQASPHELDVRFVQSLIDGANKNGWEYEVNDSCKGIGNYSDTPYRAALPMKR